MYSVQIHKVIDLIISTFYRTGVWHRGDKPNIKEKGVQLFYCIYFSLFLISTIVGAIKNDNKFEAIFLAESTMALGILYGNFFLLIWKQKEIVNLLNRVCVFSIRCEDDFNNSTVKIRRFVKFVIVFMIIVIAADVLSSVVVPLLETKKTLLLKIAFPLDYESNAIALCVATAFLVTELLFTIVFIILFIVIWYLLLNCALRYEVLGNELKNIGRISENCIVTEKQMQKQFFDDLKASIVAQKHLRGYIQLI